MMATIEHLKKVTLLLIADSAERKPVIFDFIYGVASSGLCPFENALHHKRVGEKFFLGTSASDGHEYFRHLYLPLCQTLGLQILPETINLQVEVIAVAHADNREIVQSLANALSGCGCGGSCGCGC